MFGNTSNMLKFSRAVSRVSVEQNTDVSDISSFSILRIYVVDDRTSPFTTSTLMVEIVEIPERVLFSSTLTRLITRENFSTFIGHENINSYITPIINKNCIHGEGKKKQIKLCSLL
jgi:hypothetical protein